jgi:primary-amine oxidase
VGWAFYMGFERDMGLNFWDINFRGERIIYELTPQEAMAQYCELSVVQFFADL